MFGPEPLFPQLSLAAALRDLKARSPRARANAIRALPDALALCSMRLRYRRHLLVLELTPQRLRLRSVKPGVAPIDVRVCGRAYELAGGETLECELRN